MRRFIRSMGEIGYLMDNEILNELKELQALEQSDTSKYLPLYQFS